MHSTFYKAKVSALVI